jgi:hypothetical protein
MIRGGVEMAKRNGDKKDGKDAVKNPFKHIVLFPEFVTTPETEARREELLASIRDGSYRKKRKVP